MKIETSDLYNSGSEIGLKTIDWIFNLSRREKGLADGATKRDLVIHGNISIVYACITLIANTIAQNEYKLFKKDKLLEEGTNDYIYKLLKNPNPYMDWYDFIYILTVMMEIFGERYIYIARDKLGRPVQLYPIPSFMIEPVFDKKTGLEIIGYKDLTDPTDSIKWTPDEIIYDFIPSPERINRGESPLSKVLLEFDIHYFAKKYARNFYRNGAVPQGILTTEEKLSPAQADLLEKRWKAKHQGVEKGWEIAVLWGGLKYQELSINPNNKDFIEQSNWTRNDILSVFKVPPFKLGITENINRSSAHEQNVIFARDCIKPKLVKLQSLFNNKILPKLKADEYKIEFKNPIPEDEELQVQKAKVGLTFGVLTVNEARKLLGFEPLEDEIGEQLVPALNHPIGRPTQSDEGTAVQDANKILQEIYQIDKAINSMIGE
jgi:HK97 family phage portal protein